MLNLQILFKPLTYIPKLCSITEIPEKFKKDIIERSSHNELRDLWKTFKTEYLAPKKALAGTWEDRYNMISLIEKIALATIVILACRHSHYAERLKRPVIIFDYSKIKIGISAIATVSISKFVIKTIFIYHKRVSSAAISHDAYMHQMLSMKLSEKQA